MKDTYVTAAHKAIAAGLTPDALVNALKSVMQTRGHGRLLAPVLRAILRDVAASRSERTVLRVASENEQTKHAKAIAAVLSELQATADPVVVTDETLIGGYQVEANHQRVDASYKHALASLYRSITTH
ncbi:hypothetical protein CL655_03315 [bacterium]|nr:hypothetical protein [bacterium]|tara:strand:+ start:22489 stop:22872 length:384 start_codon:yes stop_codon:yes gene_type:complete